MSGERPPAIMVSSTLGRRGGSPESLQLLRHDDLFALLGEFAERFPDQRALWAMAVTASTLVGYVLACLTLAGSQVVADRLLGSRRRSLWPEREERRPSAISSLTTTA